MKEITVSELNDWLHDDSKRKPLILDIREVWEYQKSHLPDARLMPMRTVPARLFELDRHAEIVVLCHHGVRSRMLTRFLEQQGFTAVYNLLGGIDAWSKEIDPTVPLY